MAERRKVRSGTGGRTSTRGREPADQEILDEEPMTAEEDELADVGEPEEDDAPEETDDEMADADEPEAAEDEPSGNGRRRRSRRPSMNAGQAAKAALQQIAQLTAKQPEGVTGVERAEDGWTVGIELVEDQRIPSSADILATYEATIDADGELVSYKRVRRYARGRADAEEM